MHRQYNPKRFAASWNGIKLIGVPEGEFYTVEYREEQATLVVGGQGDTTAVLNADQSATATIRLLPGAPANDMLSALRPDPDLNKLPSGVFQLVDLNGTTVVHAEVAFISKVPSVAVGKDLPMREWQLTLAKATFHVGGSSV